MKNLKYLLLVLIVFVVGACTVNVDSKVFNLENESLAVEIPLPTGNSFRYRDFYFIIPDDWKIVSEESQQVLLEMASEPYQIRTTVLFSRDNHYFPSENSLIHTSVDGLNVYNSICYGGLACYAVENKGYFTLMTWTVPSSTETMAAAAPADWQPIINFTAEDVLDIVKTIRRLE